MCGIVGYVGYRECADVLLDGLTGLEYRGYDSAGIAVCGNRKVSVVKSGGRLENLRKRLEIEGKPHGCAGIGHTRWATHGEPSDRNSHPHGGKKVTLVHNGIIENYKQLKEFLISEGETFESDTDTEVAARLLEYYYRNDHGDPMSAIARTMHELEGSFALGILFADLPDRVYAVRRESPLIVGFGKQECFVASDVTAILRYTREYCLLEHDEIAVLTQSGCRVFDLHFQEIQKEHRIADWDVSAAEKCGFAHFMLKEIHEQPAAVRMTIAPMISEGLPDFTECGITPEMLKDFRKLHIVACGTAMHAGVVGKYIIEKLAKIPVNVDTASEFRYREPIVGEGELVVVISQSGETADTLAAMRLAKALGARTLAVVNAKGSSIAREADLLIYTHAGPEIAVASTKAYMVQLAVMYLLAFALALANGSMEEAECRRLTGLLQKIPQNIEKILENKETARQIAASLAAADSLLYIGRGPDHAVSMEGSLKLKEISYIHSEAYAAGELKHGTISLITERMPVIAVATQQRLFDKTISNIREVRARGAGVILICGETAKTEQGLADHRFDLPECDDLLMPMPAAVPLQLIAYYTAVYRGTDVDKPRNLAKSVTVE